jgi:hypothetical protein
MFGSACSRVHLKRLNSQSPRIAQSKTSLFTTIIFLKISQRSVVACPPSKHNRAMDIFPSLSRVCKRLKGFRTFGTSNLLESQYQGWGLLRVPRKIAWENLSSFVSLCAFSSINGWRVVLRFISWSLYSLGFLFSRLDLFTLLTSKLKLYF